MFDGDEMMMGEGKVDGKIEDVERRDGKGKDGKEKC